MTRCRLILVQTAAGACQGISQRVGHWNVSRWLGGFDASSPTLGMAFRVPKASGGTPTSSLSWVAATVRIRLKRSRTHFALLHNGRS